MPLATELQKARSKTLLELKGKVSKFMILVGKVNTPASVIMGRTRRHKISMDAVITESLVCARLYAKHLYFIIWSAQQPISRYYCHLQFTYIYEN